MNPYQKLKNKAKQKSFSIHKTQGKDYILTNANVIFNVYKRALFIGSLYDCARIINGQTRQS